MKGVDARVLSIIIKLSDEVDENIEKLKKGDKQLIQIPPWNVVYPFFIIFILYPIPRTVCIYFG